METKQLSIKVKMQVGKTRNEVFEAIVNPDSMKKYFIGSSTGRMETGKKLQWTFPEFDEIIPVQINTITPNELISFYWDNSGTQLLVEIYLTDSLQGSTLITITEKSMPISDAGLQWLSGNSFGWSNFLSCLKAYLEYGINLRKGAFDFMSIKP